MKKKSWKYKVMDKKVDKWEKVALREGGGGGDTHMFVLDVIATIFFIKCSKMFNADCPQFETYNSSNAT